MTGNMLPTLLRSLLISALIVIFSQSVRAADIIKINEDVMVAAGDVKNNAIGVHSNVTVNGKLKENALAFLGHVTLGSGAVVHGNVMSIGGKIIKQPGAVVKGREIAVDPHLKSLEKHFWLFIPVLSALATAVIGATIIMGSIGFIVLVVLTLLFFPRQLENIRQTVWMTPLQSLLYGVVGNIIGMTVVIFLAVTIIGLPLAIIVGTLMAAAGFAGAVGVSLGVGTELARKCRWNLAVVWRGLLGVVLLIFLGAIPLFGWIVKLGAICFGLGGAIQTRFRA